MKPAKLWKKKIHLCYKFYLIFVINLCSKYVEIVSKTKNLLAWYLDLNILLRIVKYYLKLVTMKKSFQQHFPIFNKSVFLPCVFFDTPWACEKTVHVSSKFHQYDKTWIQTSGKFFSFLTLRSCNRLCMMSNEIENLLLGVDLLLWIYLLEFSRGLILANQSI